MPSKKINIIEVGPRDGLQHSSRLFSVAEKVAFIKKLSQTGLNRIELGAFVSETKIPAMASSLKVIQKVERFLPTHVQSMALVPNLNGLEKAKQTNLSAVAVFGSCSETFSQKNINVSIKRSLSVFKQVFANSKRFRKRAYLSMVWGCPYEGKISYSRVALQMKKMFDIGAQEVSLGDTIGTANPATVTALLRFLKKRGFALNKIHLHFHDTKGLALANVHAALLEGVTHFDSSVGGLGGCPYAVGSTGNIATEDLVYMLHHMGYKTGVDLDKLIAIVIWLKSKKVKINSSHVLT